MENQVQKADKELEKSKTTNWSGTGGNRDKEHESCDLSVQPVGYNGTSKAHEDQVFYKETVVAFTLALFGPV